MKALSIKQPWAYLIAKGWKDVENRDWKTNYRGRIYIHASMSQTDMNGSVYSWLYQKLTAHRSEFNNWEMALGAIIGEVDIVDCVTESSSPWFEGKYGFVLANAVMYKIPIPCKGKLGLFDPGPDFKEWKIMKPLNLGAARGN